MASRRASASAVRARQPFAWEFACGDETLRLDPPASLVAGATAADLVVDAALAGCGVVYLFEDWLRPHLASSATLPSA